MAKAKILSSFVNHLSLESSCIVNSNFSSHLLKNFCKVVSNLDLLLLVVFFSIFLLHLILILLFFVFPFLLFLLLFRFLLLFGLLLLIKKLYLITCANSKPHLLISSEILSTRYVTMMVNPFDKSLDMFIYSHTFNIPDQNKHASCSCNSHIHSPPILQKPNFSSRIAPYHRYNNALLFTTLNTIYCRDIQRWQSFLAD